MVIREMELIRLEMTPKERAAAYARGEEVDRIPTTLSAGETAPPLYGIDICDYYFSADAMVEVESRLAEDFQADNLGMGLGLRSLLEALGTKMKYPKKSVSYIDVPALKSFDELEGRELVNIEKDGRLPIMLEAFYRLQDKYGEVRNLGSGLAGPFTTAAGLIGTENFLKTMLKKPEKAHKLLQYSTDNVVKCCKDFHDKLGINFMISEPMGSGELLSKRQFEKFFVPYLKQCVERMSEFQNIPSIHICGRTRDRWDEVVNAGVSGFWIDNTESLEEFKGLYGDKVSLSGNLSPVEVLKNGTPQEIADHVRECIREAGDNPRGYNLCPGCTTPVGTTKENMIAFMNAAAIYGRRARKGCVPEGLKQSV